MRLKNLILLVSILLLTNISPVDAQGGFHRIAQFGTDPRVRITWSPDGKMLAVVNFSSVVLYTPDFKKIDEFDAQPSDVVDVAWSPDGKYLAGIGEALWIWNVATHYKRVLWPYDIRNNQVSMIVWSPDGTRLLTGEGDVWDIKSGKVLVTFKHEIYLRDIAWSPDGRWIATSSNRVQIWDAKTYALQSVLWDTDVKVSIAPLAWSADSKYIVGLNAFREIVVWNMQLGKRAVTLHTQSGYVWGLTWSHDGKYLAGLNPSIHIWNTRTWEENSIGDVIKDGITDLAWNPDGKLATLSSNEVTIWDINSGQQLRTLSNDDYIAGSPVSWSPDSKQIALGVGNIIQIRDGVTGELLRKFDTHYAIKKLVWSPKSSLAATIDDQASLHIWDINAEQLVKNLPIQAVMDVAWSPDGSQLAILSSGVPDPTSSADVFYTRNNVILLDTINWKMVAKFKADCFSWSPDNKALAISIKSHAYIVDSHSGLILVDFGAKFISLFGSKRFSPLPIFALYWSPRGDRIVAVQYWPLSGSPRVGNDFILDVKSGKTVADEKLSVSFGWHPNGKVIARNIFMPDPRYARSTYVDMQIYNLDTKSAQTIRDITFVAWSPDGKRLIAKSFRGNTFQILSR